MTHLPPFPLFRFSLSLLVLLALVIPGSGGAQSGIDHWETAVFNNDVWSYNMGTSEPPNDWMQPQFDDREWLRGEGGFGYGDNDDNTTIPNTISLYIRIKFDLADTSKIDMAVLHADYDDAFVAYLNGTEFARGNFGEPGTPPAYDDMPAIDREARLYRGRAPEAYPIYPPSFDQLAQEGENTLAIQIHNFRITSSDFSSNFFLSLGVNDDSRDFAPTPEWFYAPFIATELPLVRVNTLNQIIVDEPKIVANMQIVDNGPGAANFFDDPATDYDGRIAIEIRGASSQSFEKKNYGFETQDPAGENNNVSLLGLPRENDWILHGPYSDKSLIRNALTFHIGGVMMEYASRTRFCELIINNDYRGIYLLMERIKRDDERVDIARLRPEDIGGDELTGGYIFQIDRDDRSTDEDGWYSPYGSNPFYAFHSPDFDDLVPEQEDYIQDWMTDFEFAMLQPNYAATFESYVDAASFIDYFLINELTKHVDAFKLSFYMYKRKDSNGGKLHMGPIWDFNLGYGNFNFECPEDPRGWIYPCTSRAFWLDRIMTVSSVQDRMYCRWQALRQEELSTPALMARIDAMVDKINPAVDRNFDRFGILGAYVWPNAFVGSTHEEEITYLKTWLTQRLEWMDDNMFGNSGTDCEALTSVSEVNQPNYLTVYPTPFNDRIVFSLREPPHQNGVVTIFDIVGRPVSSFPPTGQQSIDASSWPAGLYFYEYREGRQLRQRGKIIKQ